MACEDCERRRKMLRDAVLHGKMADALDITVEGLRVMIGIDAKADHRAEAEQSKLVVGDHAPEIPSQWGNEHKLVPADGKPKRRSRKGD